MDSKIQLLSVLVFVLASFNVILTGSHPLTPDDSLTAKGDEKVAGSPRLVGVGNFNGKLYFSDNSTLLTWSEADALCKANFLRLVQIDSPAEFTYLKATLNTSNYYAYWTSGRDNQHFTWGDGTHVNIPTTDGDRMGLFFFFNFGIYPRNIKDKTWPLCQSV